MTDTEKTARQNEAKISTRAEKDTYFQDQFDIVYQGFFKQPQTMKMLSVQTRIDRANICWYCRYLRKTEQIVSVKKGTCPITKHKANYWTTNPALFPISSQLKLF